MSSLTFQTFMSEIEFEFLLFKLQIFKIVMLLEKCDGENLPFTFVLHMNSVHIQKKKTVGKQK